MICEPPMAFMWRAAERGACGEWHAPSMGTFITWSTTGLKCVVVVSGTCPPRDHRVECGLVGVVCELVCRHVAIQPG